MPLSRSSERRSVGSLSAILGSEGTQPQRRRNRACGRTVPYTVRGHRPAFEARPYAASECPFDLQIDDPIFVRLEGVAAYNSDGDAGRAGNRATVVHRTYRYP